MPAPGPVDPTTLVGKQARTFMIRVRPIGVLPPASSVSLIGGHVDVTKTPAPEIDLCYFMTDTIEVEGIAASTRHGVSAVGTALGRIDVGNAWVLPPTVTVQHHFLPHGTLSPCVDAGRTAAFFTDSQPVGPMITRSSRSATMSALHTCRHRRDLLRGHWFADLDAKQVVLDTTFRRVYQLRRGQTITHWMTSHPERSPQGDTAVATLLTA